MPRLGGSNSIFCFLLVVIACALCVPLHLYPLTNYIEELLVSLGVLLAAGWLLWGRAQLRVSLCGLLWLALGGLFVMSVALHESAFLSGKLFYLFFWFIGALAILIGEQVDWGTERSSDLLAWIMMWCALVCGVFGLFRHFGMLWEGLGAFVPHVDSARMVGLIGHSNFFAYVCLLGLISIAWLYGRRKVSLIGLAAGGAILVFCFLLSGSRSAMVAWVVLVSVLLLRRDGGQISRFNKTMIFLVVTSFLLLPFMPTLGRWLATTFPSGQIFDDRIVALGQRGVESSGRVVEWQIAWNLFLDNWWGGVGVGNYAGQSFERHVELGLPSPPGLFLHSHNSLLQLAVELGVAGAIWSVAVVFLMVRFGWRAMGDSYRVLPASVLLIFLVYSAFEFPLWIMHFLVLNLLLVGALVKRYVLVTLTMGRLFSVVLLLVLLSLSIIYVPLVERFYWSFVQYQHRAPVDASEYSFINPMLKDPVMEPYGYMIYFANFQMSQGSLENERATLERFRRYMPFAPLVARLAFVQVASGRLIEGRKSADDLRAFYGESADRYLLLQLKEASAAFPDSDFSILFESAENGLSLSKDNAKFRPAAGVAQ